MGSGRRRVAVWAAVAIVQAAALSSALAETAVAPTAKPATTQSTGTASSQGSSTPAPTKKGSASQSGTAKNQTTKRKAAAATKPAGSTTTSKPPASTTGTKPAAPVATKPVAPAATAPKPTVPAEPAKATALPPQQATPLQEAAPVVSPLPGAPTPVTVPTMSFRQSHPWLGGFLTGLLGVGLADTLLGGEVVGDRPGEEGKAGNLLEPVETSGGTGELAGQIMRLALIGGLVALAVAAWRRRTRAGPTTTGAPRRRSTPELSGWDDVAEDRAEPVLSPITARDDFQVIADEQEFADILLVVQAAWSEGNVMAMRGHVTPDMAAYFDRRLAHNSENGVENRVVDVSGIRVERLEDWDEPGGLHFAKARMHWRAIDYIIDLSKLPDEAGYVIDGSPEEQVECEEVWTFVKSPDGAWILYDVEPDS